MSKGLNSLSNPGLTSILYKLSKKGTRLKQILE